MYKEIDRIMRIGDKGYVDDFADIGEIPENFLNYTVKTLTCILPPGYKVQEFADNIVRKISNIELVRRGII